ncbi:MAG: UbiA-like polyprenyltransferase [Candidatus Micrarchaeia archaeon]
MGYNKTRIKNKRKNVFFGISDMLKLKYTIFSLFFIYIGMLLAAIPTLMQFILLNIAAVFARASGMSANRYIGYDYDKKNPKKKMWSSIRLFKKNEILLLFVLFSFIFILSAFFLNLLAFILSPLVILLFIIEPKIKKYTQHRHLIMGLINGLGIFGGYIAITGTIPYFWSIFILWLGYGFMLGGSDIIYSMNYIEYDKKNKLKTYPVVYGKKHADLYSIYFHTISFLFFLMFGIIINSIFIIIAVLASGIVLTLWHIKIKTIPNISFSYYNGLISTILLIGMFLTVFK